MVISKYVNIATKAYQQAVKYEHVSEEMRQQLFHFIHDWFRMVEDENQAIADNEETPLQMFNRQVKEKFNE